MITVEYITEQLKDGKYPNMLPDDNFRKKHQQLIKDYKDEVNLYKGNCYKELNTYFKTGELIDQGGCDKGTLKAVMNKIGNTTAVTRTEMIKVVADRLVELYNVVEPYDKDVIVYRGVRRGTIGQNLFNGNCIKTRLYSLDEHRFCNNDEMVWPQFLEDRPPDGDPRDYVYETLGFASTTTAISTAYAFAKGDQEMDTLIALRLPAGTKFLMPRFTDYESELILFPLHNTFVLNNQIDNGKNVFYVGAYCNDVNQYRPKDSPKIRQLKTKILNPVEWAKHKYKTEPLNLIDVCPENCEDILHYCDPETHKCIGDSQKSRDKILNWWKSHIRGKCDKKKVDECLAEDGVCNPEDGTCFDPKNQQKWFVGGKLGLIANYRDPEEIIAAQKPHLKCDKKRIEECANKNKVCNPLLENDCWEPNSLNNIDHLIYRAGNVLDKNDPNNRIPVGKCTSKKIASAFAYEKFCDPDTGKRTSYKPENDSILKKLQKIQKENQPKFAKITDYIQKNQELNGKCTKELIDKCSKKGMYCNPHGWNSCFESDKNYYQQQNLQDDAYKVNNMFDPAVISKLPVHGKCTAEKLYYCPDDNKPCLPDIGCFNIKPENEDKITAMKKYIEEIDKRKKELAAILDESTLALLAKKYPYDYNQWKGKSKNITLLIAYELKNNIKITKEIVDKLTAEITKRKAAIKKWATIDLLKAVSRQYNIYYGSSWTIDDFINEIVKYEQLYKLTTTKEYAKQLLKALQAQKAAAAQSVKPTTKVVATKGKQTQINKMKKAELVAELNALGLSTKGYTPTLKKRLIQYYQYKTKKVTELKALLKQKGLKTTGNKNELIKRLMDV